ncbi:MAG: SDR family NAD(P)-dependent oxidoreductase, partial [Deltaproteobacteria bacterium]|nr:SDR family NAD(P)-dependent oxidoreductase [Deltaproteobacteria bacterium]
MAEDRAAGGTVGVKDKVVLVTGASRGIGACCVRALLDGGASVVLHYNRNRDAAETLAEAAPERCRLVGADLADEAAPEALWQQALAWRGRIDVLVNNAAAYEAEPAFADDDAWPAAWRAVWLRTLQLNLLAPAELATRAVAHFRARGDGGILIHLSSRAAHRGEKPLLGSYAASKGALNALSHTLARTHGGDGILSYAVAPGWVGTDMSWDYINETGDRG